MKIKELAGSARLRVCRYDTEFMLCLLRSLAVLFIRVFRSRRDLLLENLVLRRQLVVLKQRKPRPPVSTSDKLFWVILRRLWPEWRHALILVQPETVVRWHRAGFKLYWTWLSRRRVRAGRKCISKELRELIFRMVAENCTWGAPRIHGELKMLGFDLSERTVLRWMWRAPRCPEPAKQWAAFLNNHREALAAMDFFTVPTLTFGVLYCFFVIAHDRQRILHCNVTGHPNSAWVVQHLREAFPYDSAPKFLIFDGTVPARSRQPRLRSNNDLDSHPMHQRSGRGDETTCARSGGSG